MATTHGGLWALGEREIVHLKGGVVTSHFNLDGLQHIQQISEDPDGSLWVVRGVAGFQTRPFAISPTGAIKCFGKSDGVPISPANAVLSEEKEGFWLGGQTVACPLARRRLGDIPNRSAETPMQDD